MTLCLAIGTENTERCRTIHLSKEIKVIRIYIEHNKAVSGKPGLRISWIHWTEEKV